MAGGKTRQNNPTAITAIAIRRSLTLVRTWRLKRLVMAVNLETCMSREILSDLNPAQQDAVTFGHTPLLILAGAGSGKTRVLTHRVAYLITHHRIQPGHILLLTFTNKAAQEMLSRVKGLLKAEVPIMGGTFHSWGAKVLRRHGGRIGLDPNFVIFDEADQIDTIKMAMGYLGLDIKTNKPASVLGAISNAKNELIGPNEYSGFARGNFTQTVARVYTVYQQLLKKYNALDFDDLLGELVRLISVDKDTLKILQDKFLYVLIDEYQDTNKAQYEITKRITKEYRHLTVVGDAAQAIYSWRGADYRNLVLLKQDFPDLTTINLDQNYRSTQTILSVANQIISKNSNHPILKLWTSKGGGDKIEIYQAQSETDEARYVIESITSRVKTKHRDYSDFAVLYRTNAQSRALEEAFIHFGVPYTLVGGIRFYERKEIKDIIAYLRIVLNENDEVSKKRAEKNGKGKLKKLMDWKQSWNNSYGSLETLDQVLQKTQYLDQFEIEDNEDAGRVDNIKELRSVASQYPTVVEFLENIALTEKESKKGYLATGGAVVLMTLHAAKGLEFPEVFMVGMEEGLFPHSRALMDNEQMEEERRLCYVGVTRAMEKLYFSFAIRRLYFGQRTSNLVSRFLGDISQDLVSNSQTINKSAARLMDLSGELTSGWGFDEKGIWRWKPE